MSALFIQFDKKKLRGLLPNVMEHARTTQGPDVDALIEVVLLLGSIAAIFPSVDVFLAAVIMVLLAFEKGISILQAFAYLHDHIPEEPVVIGSDVA